MQNASSMRGSAAGSSQRGAAVLGALDNATFPIVAVVGIIVVVLVVIAFSVSLCSSAGRGQESEQVQTVTQEETANEGDIPEELKWRDSEFAVDPSFTGWSTKDNGRKVVYLTVDDGPSELTEQMLDLFDEYDVKATFFVTGQNPQYYDLIREAYKRGHTIGLHSMTHKYDQIYSSEAAFFEDLDAIGKLVEEQIGYVPCFIRFPGGSSNGLADQYSQGLMPKLAKSALEKGYQYYDWSLSTGDGDGDLSAEQLVSISTTSDAGEGGYDPTEDTNIVLLCHDAPTKQTTLEALPKIIEYYKDKGYTFEAIDRTTWVCHHYVENNEDLPAMSANGNATGNATGTATGNATGTATGTDTAASTTTAADSGTQTGDEQNLGTQQDDAYGDTGAYTDATEAAA